MSLIIHTEQLEEGKKERIKATLPPDFLAISEAELSFKSPILLSGEAVVITDHLILLFSAKTEALMPCSVCNKNIRISIQVQEISHTLPLSEMASSIFDYTDLVREEILLQIPQFVECSSGKCPERPQIDKFLKKPGNFPFADL